MDEGPRRTAARHASMPARGLARPTLRRRVAGGHAGARHRAVRRRRDTPAWGRRLMTCNNKLLLPHKSPSRRRSTAMPPREGIRHPTTLGEAAAVRPSRHASPPRQTTPAAGAPGRRPKHMGTIPTATDPGAEAERCPPQRACGTRRLSDTHCQAERRPQTRNPRESDRRTERGRASVRRGPGATSFAPTRRGMASLDAGGFRIPTLVVTGRLAEMRLGDGLALHLFNVKVPHPSWHLPVTCLQDVGDSAAEFNNVLGVAPTERVGAVCVGVAYPRMTQCRSQRAAYTRGAPACPRGLTNGLRVEPRAESVYGAPGA